MEKEESLNQDKTSTDPSNESNEGKKQLKEEKDKTRIKSEGYLARPFQWGLRIFLDKRYPCLLRHEFTLEY